MHVDTSWANRSCHASTWVPLSRSPDEYGAGLSKEANIVNQKQATCHWSQHDLLLQQRAFSAMPFNSGRNSQFVHKCPSEPAPDFQLSKLKNKLLATATTYEFRTCECQKYEIFMIKSLRQHVRWDGKLRYTLWQWESCVGWSRSCKKWAAVQQSFRYAAAGD